MFERYTEKARRVIFFARYEASQFDSPRIETEHLLLGLLREDKALTNRFLRGQGEVEAIRKQVEDHTTVREKVSTSVDLPLSEEGKRALSHAAEEAERLSHKHIGTEHLLLGLLREEMSFAARILNEHGIHLSAVREELSRAMEEQQPIAPKAFVLLSEFSGYITRIARKERYSALIGREKEFEQMVHILGRSNKNNVVLVGEPGVGKKTMVEELAQRVADNKATASLQSKLFVSLDLAMVVMAAQHSRRSTEFLNAITAEMVKAEKDTLFLFDELHALLAAGPEGGAHEIILLLKPALLSGKVRCIASATPAEHHAALEKAPWLNERFLAVKVEAPTEETAVKILQVEKDRFEKFHSVQFTDVIRGKPSPEPFLKGADLLGTTPADCLVFEDSPAGIASARSAGMKAIALQTTYTADQLQAAHAIIGNLADVTAILRDVDISLELAPFPAAKR